MCIEYFFDGVEKRYNPIEFFCRQLSPQFCADSFQSVCEFVEFAREAIVDWIVWQNHSQRLECSAVAPSIQQLQHLFVKFRVCHR